MNDQPVDPVHHRFHPPSTTQGHVQPPDSLVIELLGPPVVPLPRSADCTIRRIRKCREGGSEATNLRVAYVPYVLNYCP